MEHYPRTDEEWEKLAECIVTKTSSISPEVVGEYTVEATQTIFTWYRGEERNKALRRRADARGRLMELGKQAGCLSEEVREEIKLSGEMMEVPIRQQAYYWEVTNMVKGEIINREDDPAFGSITAATADAKRFMDEDYQDCAGDHLVIKVFTQSAGERLGVTYTPVHTESYWVAEEARHSLPTTYGDWVSLAEDIKARMPEESWHIVNELLQVISEDAPEADEAKRWLVLKAGELGIR